VGTIIVSGKLGPKRNQKSNPKNFECGVEGIGNARIPFSVKYFLVAILFVLLMSKLSFFILDQFQRIRNRRNGQNGDIYAFAFGGVFSTSSKER
jgi:hypothetical protein